MTACKVDQSLNFNGTGIPKVKALSSEIPLNFRLERFRKDQQKILPVGDGVDPAVVADKICSDWSGILVGITEIIMGGMNISFPVDITGDWP